MSHTERAILSMMKTELTSPATTAPTRAALLRLIRDIENGKHLGMR